jgi:hypothetical protein
MITRQSVLLSLSLAAAAVPATAASHAADMRVSVVVVARTIISVDQQPTTVQVSAGDVARGYVDLPQAIAFRIRSNAANGYTLQVGPIGAPFTHAEITWNTIVMVVGNDSTSVRQQYQPGTTNGVLSVRLLLAPTTVPGSYPWPIQLTAASL